MGVGIGVEQGKELGHREMDAMNQFQDKVSIIAGGTSGIGRPLGEELAQRGARVILERDLAISYESRKIRAKLRLTSKILKSNYLLFTPKNL
jgi:hypothetical protein